MSNNQTTDQTTNEKPKYLSDFYPDLKVPYHNSFPEDAIESIKKNDPHKANLILSDLQYLLIKMLVIHARGQELDVPELKKIAAEYNSLITKLDNIIPLWWNPGQLDKENPQLFEEWGSLIKRTSEISFIAEYVVDLFWDGAEYADGKIKTLFGNDYKEVIAHLFNSQK